MSTSEGGGGSSWQEWVDGSDLPVEPPVPQAADEDFLRRLSLPSDEHPEEPPAPTFLQPREDDSSDFAPLPVAAPATAPAPAPAPAATARPAAAPLLPQLAEQVRDARAAVDDARAAVEALGTRLDRLEDALADSVRAVDARLDDQATQLADLLEELGRLRKRMPVRARDGAAGVDQPTVERMADVIVERLSGQFEVVIEPDPEPEPAPKPQRSTRAPPSPARRLSS